MAWIQMDTHLEQKPEYARLLRLTKASRAELTRRIFQLWCWIDAETEDGFFPGLDEHDLSARFEGTTPEFWQAFCDKAVQWLDFTPEGIRIPGYEKRFSESAKKRANDAKRAAKKRKIGNDEGEKVARNATNVASNATKVANDATVSRPRIRDQRSEKESDIPDQSNQSLDPAQPSKAPTPNSDGSDQKDAWDRKKLKQAATVEVDSAAVADIAQELFAQAGYSGSDGRIFWEAAAVLEAMPGGFTRFQAVDAARGCRDRGNKPGYFRTSMRNLCPDFEDRLLRVWIHPELPTKPPDKLTARQRSEITLRSVPDGERPPDQRGVMKQIEALERMERSNA